VGGTFLRCVSRTVVSCPSRKGTVSLKESFHVAQHRAAPARRHHPDGVFPERQLVGAGSARADHREGQAGPRREPRRVLARRSEGVPHVLCRAGFEPSRPVQERREVLLRDRRAADGGHQGGQGFRAEPDREVPGDVGREVGGHLLYHHAPAVEAVALHRADRGLGRGRQDHRFRRRGLPGFGPDHEGGRAPFAAWGLVPHRQAQARAQGRSGRLLRQEGSHHGDLEAASRSHPQGGGGAAQGGDHPERAEGRPNDHGGRDRPQRSYRQVERFARAPGHPRHHQHRRSQGRQGGCRGAQEAPPGRDGPRLLVELDPSRGRGRSEAQPPARVGECSFRVRRRARRQRSRHWLDR